MPRTGDKLTGDFGNEFGALLIGDRGNFFLTKKSVPNNFGPLQQYRLIAFFERGRFGGVAEMRGHEAHKRHERRSFAAARLAP
jgi:hypothetical protein